MTRRFSKIAFALTCALLLLATSNAFAAGTCGAGKITHIKEGGWNSNDFMIKIDYATEASSVGGEWRGYIRFPATLNADRFKGIKALAYMAFSGNKTVRIWTSGSSCDAANDLTIYAVGSHFP